MRHAKVTYIDGSVAEGDNRPFDVVSWERHFDLATGVLQMRVEAESAKLQSAGMDVARAAELAYQTHWRTEYDLFYAYLICKRAGCELDFDGWGEQLATVEWSEPEGGADPLAPTPPSGS